MSRAPELLSRHSWLVDAHLQHGPEYFAIVE
jgi:hypothetical protein